MNLKPVLLFFAACLAVNACKQQDAKVVHKAADTPAKPVIEEPFKYHKMIEVAPGQYYDVLSWGRGTKEGGAYMILRSDSADQQYNSATGDLEGPIKDVLNADLDIDGNPEIIILAKSVDTTRFTSVFAYEYHDDNAIKLDFPRLTALQRKGYRGGDNFYIKDSKLMRQFPIYEGSGAQAKTLGQNRLLEYTLHNNNFSVKQVSKDSTLISPVSTEMPVITEPVKSVKKETHKTSKKNNTLSKHHKVAERRKKHKSTVQKKRKRRRG